MVPRQEPRLEYPEGSRTDGRGDQTSFPEDEHPREVPQLEGVSPY